MSRIGDEAIADDVTQNFWVNIWQEPQLVKVDENGTAKRFLLHLFSFRMINYLKATSTKLISAKNSNSLDEINSFLSYTHVFEELELNEFNHIIDEIIGDFPDLMQKIFILLYREELSIKDTAKQLNINEKTVSYKSKAVINEIRERLKAMDIQNGSINKSESLLTLFVLFYFFK